jgi:membrane fusion protein, multidrug efflux system
MRARATGLPVALAIALTATLAAAQTPNAAADPQGRIRTQLSARNAVTLSAEIAARIASLPVREGDSFRAGQTIVSFDCGLYQSQLQKAEAAVEGANAVLKTDLRMADLNAIGQGELDQARARLKEAQADVAAARQQTSRCAIAAPFTGRVARRRAAAFEYVTPGTPLLDVVETGHLELQMIVPSKWLAWLRPGLAFSVDVDELGARFAARVQRIGAQIDPVSQTVTVFGLIDGTPPRLLPGMSGWAVFAGHP